VPLLVMPAMLESLILGMDFLTKIGTTIRCGNASLTLARPPAENSQSGPSAAPPPDARSPEEQALPKAYGMTEHQGPNRSTEGPCFTKWVELLPMRKATTRTLIRAFRERNLGRFGAPRKMVCDNSTQFISKAFRKFLRETGVELQHTAPYCPRDNLLPELTLAVKTSV
ncbi:hypothetical protein KR032_012156, partial [Drosophila birchii]